MLTDDFSTGEQDLHFYISLQKDGLATQHESWGCGKLGKADRVCEMIKVSNREKKQQQLALPSGLYQFDYFSQMNSEYTEAWSWTVCR